VVNPDSKPIDTDPQQKQGGFAAHVLAGSSASYASHPNPLSLANQPNALSSESSCLKSSLHCFL
jgi:hypothetical protein